MSEKVNVYDFDKTIYKGDSTIDLYIYCLSINPKIFLHVPVLLTAYWKYKNRRITKTEFKEKFYSFLKEMTDIDQIIECFWLKNGKKIASWYRKQQSEEDVIISASPEFLLRPICNQLNIKYLIASKVDKNIGKYDGLNCYGEEKVKRFQAEFPNKVIDKFYSDSKSDLPLAKIAVQSFLVVGTEKLIEWKLSS